jgi:uncharacterized membrane protein YdbT with pleckstrin-like domain
MEIRKDEVLLKTAVKHWSRYISPAMVSLSVMFVSFKVSMRSPDNVGMDFPAIFAAVIVGLLIGAPLWIKEWLVGKTSKYIVTNTRFYICEGILRRNVVELSLRKVNDIRVEQSLWQRMFGSGNIRVLSGNATGDVIKGLDRPDELKECIAAASETLQSTTQAPVKDVA